MTKHGKRNRSNMDVDLFLPITLPFPCMYFIAFKGIAKYVYMWYTVGFALLLTLLKNNTQWAI